MSRDDARTRGPRLGRAALDRLSALAARQDLAILQVGASLRLGFESALARVSFRWHPLAPDVLAVLLRQVDIDTPVLLTLCAPHLDRIWIWSRRDGWTSMRPVDGRIVGTERSPLVPFLPSCPGCRHEPVHLEADGFRCPACDHAWLDP